MTAVSLTHQRAFRALLPYQMQQPGFNNEPILQIGLTNVFL
jgi:hypothetical protein